MPGPYRQRIFPKPNDGIASYLGSMNMDIVDGKMVPAFDHGRVSGETDFVHFVVTTIEYKAPNGNPRHYILVNKSAYRWEDGALTLDGSFTDVVQGGAIVDNGSNTPILLATFGDSGTVNGHYYRDLTTDAAPWTLNSGATKLTAFLITTVGPDIYAATGTSGQGRTLLGEHKVGKCPPGTDPRTAANWGAGEPVGNTADWPINALVACRDSVVAGRGDGAYYRNDTSKLWEPIIAMIPKLPHGLNCKGAAAGENVVYIPMNDGTVFEYDGTNARVVTPYHHEPIAKDALRGRISAIADRGPQVYMHEEPHHSYLNGPQAAAAGVRFWKIQGAGLTESEITANVTDGSLVTGASMSSWGAFATDRLIITSPFPLEGIIPFVTRNANAAANRFASPVVLGALAAEVSLGNIVDFTRLSTSTISLALLGFPPAATQAYLGWDAINAFDLAVLQATFTIATVGLSNVFVYKFAPANTTGFTSAGNGTTIDEIGVIEARQGLPVMDGDATLDYTHLDRAGMLSKIHVADRVGGDLTNWRTVYALDTHGGVQGLAWTTAGPGALSNGGYGLLVLGRERQFQIAEGILRDVTRTPRARVTQFTTTEAGPIGAIRNVAFEEGPGRGADPSRPKVIVGYDIIGDYIQPADQVDIIVELDNGRTGTRFMDSGGSPLFLRNSDYERAPCRKVDEFICIQDTTQGDPFPPQIREIWRIWDYGPAEHPPQDPPFEIKAAS